jgi:uncharacterized membrane protein (DUF2068 family)
VDWSLLDCGRYGHVTYAPDEPAVRERLSAQVPGGMAWRCLRCAAFVTGEPSAHGPAARAPQVRRGKDIRSALILRIFAIERVLRAILFGAAAYVVWRFEYRKVSIEHVFNRELPVLRTLFRQLGYDIDHSKLVGLINRALTLSSSTIRLLAVGLAVYAVIELVEGAGLWLGKRWGEYFAMIVTSLGLPYEIYDLTSKITPTRAIFFAINLALVAYLVSTKRLFGVRGGKQAYEARLRSESVIDAALADVAAAAPQAAALAGLTAAQAHPVPAGQPGNSPAQTSPAQDETAQADPAASGSAETRGVSQ